MIRIKDIKIREDLLEEKVLEKALQKNRLQKEDVKKWYIYKKSIDARKKEDIFYNYTIDIELKDNNKEKRFEKIEEYKMPEIKVKRTSKIQPVIIGAGPAGLFSALIFVENGIKPILIERGKRVEDRVKDVEEFINNRKFNPKSNIQFGERRWSRNIFRRKIKYWKFKYIFKKSTRRICKIWCAKRNNVCCKTTFRNR